MFCSKCGNELADGAKFCSKCGSAVENVHTSDTVTRTVHETGAVEHVSSLANESGKRSEKTNKNNLLRRYLDRYKNRWKQCKQEHFKGRKNIGWIAVNVIIALVVLYNIAISFICNRDLNGLTYVHFPFISGETAQVRNGFYSSKPLWGKSINVKSRVRIGFKMYDVDSVYIDSGILTDLSTVKSFTCNLSSDKENSFFQIYLDAMPNVESVWVDYNQEGYVSTRKNHKKLRTLSVKSSEREKRSSSVHLDGEFPNLQSLSLENIHLSFNDDFAPENLTRVNITLPNKYLASYMSPYSGDELTVSKTLMYITALPDAEINITHSIKDLYGKWEYRDSDGNEVFSITFQDNGYVRINDGMGIIGVDLLTFSEIDNNTLLLKAETGDYWGDILTLNLPYELYGRYLYISIYGQELELINYDHDYAVN